MPVPLQVRRYQSADLGCRTYLVRSYREGKTDHQLSQPVCVISVSFVASVAVLAAVVVRLALVHVVQPMGC